MSETLAVFKISWEQMLIYRLNFILWRIRTVLQFLFTYFIWWSVFATQNEVFGYSQSTILTYVLMVTMIRAIVLSSRANDIINKINDGSISNFLLKPIGLFKFFIAQDFADKLLNTFFMIIEVSLIILFFKPVIFLQPNLVYIVFFIISLFLAAVLWFQINMVIGLMAFWVENSWSQLFLLMIFIEGLGGGLFPLDILPKYIFTFLMLTPFPYLVYFPAKIYLGGFSPEQNSFYFLIFLCWVLFLFFFMKLVLKKGLKHYSSEGG